MYNMRLNVKGNSLIDGHLWDIMDTGRELGLNLGTVRDITAEEATSYKLQYGDALLIKDRDETKHLP